MQKINLVGDKYSVANDNGTIFAYIYGKKHNFYIGDNFILALVQTLESLIGENEALRKANKNKMISYDI